MKFTFNLDQVNIKNDIYFCFKNKFDHLPKNIKLSNYNFQGNYKELLHFRDNNKTIFVIGLGDKLTFKYYYMEKIINYFFTSIKYLKIVKFNIIVNNIDYYYMNIQNLSHYLVVYNYDNGLLKTESNLNKIKFINFIFINIKIKDWINTGLIIGNAQNYIRNLQNLPSNICNTDYLFNEAKSICNLNEKFTFTYLNQKDMEDNKMGCILGVSRGSKMPPYIACMEYKGSHNTEDKPIVLIGKGLVFDSGGICLKSSNNMLNMKMDMGGASVILGLMKIVALLNIPLNIIGVISLVENAIGSQSFKPGDVLTSMSGKNVEIGHTDAEGRLVLCDTLTYIKKYNPDVVIDIATLTGAVIVALGSDINGIFSNNDELANDLLKSSIITNDHAWRLPLHSNYKKFLHSDIADINNMGINNEAGSILAAMYLEYFAHTYKWAHLDIAGTSMSNDIRSKSTGRPLPLLVNYLLNKSKKYFK